MFFNNFAGKNQLFGLSVSGTLVENGLTKKDTRTTSIYINIHYVDLVYFFSFEHICPDNHCDALRDLVPFVQFKKREKYPWRSATFSKVAGF